MSTSIAQRQQENDQKSGHISTLTSEQRALLRQLWTLVLNVLQQKSSKPDKAISNSQSNLSTSSKKISKAKKSNPENGLDDTEINLDNPNDKYNESVELKEALELYTPKELFSALWGLNGADDPDMILLRFLRARKWDVNKALAMLISTLKWRLQVDVTSIIEKGEDGLSKYFIEKGDDGFHVQLTSGKSFSHGTDKENRPICFINVRYHKKSEQGLEVLKRFTIWTMETVRMMISPPVETACLLFNMTGFSLQNMDLSYVKFIIRCFEAYYPESLGICIVHKAPWVFQGIWRIISPLLDPVVASKIRFTRDDKDLLEFIPAEHLLSSMGGEEKWEYQYVPPVDGENDRMKDEISKKEKTIARQELEVKFVEITRQWTEDLDNEQIKKARDELKVQLRKAQLELDPYIRARTYYHRTNVLHEDGTCDWGYTR